MIENGPGNVPSLFGLPLGQSSSMLESQFNTLLEAIESETISKNDIMQLLLGDDEIGSKSDDNNNQLDDEQNNADARPNKRMRHYRHTQQQIQEVEALFKECPQPDRKQRMKLSRKLGLEPLQNQGEHDENSLLRAQNDKLRAECLRLSEAINSTCCPNCGNPRFGLGETSYNDQQFRIENAFLKEE
ncbi:hypothetical protein HAX54_005333 [Datura stramonium]|uniref:Homeobox domain-containing protein n=1 Tax=Datura stramonium TaxID=4076 RepID=A0ABS8T8I6_DATST|nr:hypothetical protein [Datura stramonium]